MKPSAGFGLQRGDAVWLDGRDCIFTGVINAQGQLAGPDVWKFEDATTGAPVVLSRAQFNKLYTDAKVRLARQQRSSPRSPLCVAPEGESERQRRRRLWCEAYDNDPVSKSDTALNAFIGAVAPHINASGPPPSAGALRTWLRERGEAGDRRPGLMVDRRSSVLPMRIGELSRRLLAEEAERFFDGMRANPQAIYFATRARVVELNREREAQGLPPILAPSESTVRRYLRRHLDYRRATTRLGWREGGRRFQPILGSMRADHILELAVIDQTRVDCAVIDDEHLINVGRPWLAVMIDVKSRYPLGFHLSFEAPSVETVLACVRQGVRPKPKLEGLDGEWVGFGVPETIVVDNAWENTGSSFRDACADAGISITFAPVATPEYKGVVERFFHTLNTMLLHRLPGGLPLTPQLRKRLEIDPEIEAALPLSDLRRAIHQCIVEVYGREFHKGLGAAPEQMWRKHAGMHGRPYADDLAALDIALAKLSPRERTLSRAGVTHQDLSYNSPEALAQLLADLLPRQAPRSSRPGTARVKLKYHPEDLGRVYVWNPVRRSYAVLECTQPDYAQGLSEHQHRTLRAFATAEHLAFQSEDERCLARKRLQDLIIPEIPLRKVRDRQHAMRQISRPSALETMTPPPDAILVETLAARGDEGRPHRASAPARKRRVRALKTTAQPGAPKAAFGDLFRDPANQPAIASAGAFAEFFEEPPA